MLVAVVVAGFLAGGGTTTAAPPTACATATRRCAPPACRRVAWPPPTTRCRCRCPAGSPRCRSGPISGQLADGIHGLLIDTHYAERFRNGRLRTDDKSIAELRQGAERDGVSPAAVEAALRIRDRLGCSGDDGERGMYLCHSFCELGGTTLSSVLDDIRDFLVANRDEVLVIVNQDYVEPADFVEAVRDAKLERYAYGGPIDDGGRRCGR